MKTFWVLSCGWFLPPEGVPSLQSYKRIPKEEHHISTMFPDLSSSHTCWFLQFLPSQFITLTHVSYLHFFLIKISTINLLGCFMSVLANHLHFLTPDLLLSRPLVVKSCYSTGGPMAWVLLPGSLWEMQNLKACPRINKSESALSQDPQWFIHTKVWITQALRIFLHVCTLIAPESYR